jgi:hypothetical protein
MDSQDVGIDLNSWTIPGHNHYQYSQDLAPLGQLPLASLPDASRTIPDIVQPQDLISHDLDTLTDSPGSSSTHERSGSVESTSSTLTIHQHELLRRMSLAATDLNEDSYRPRNAPAKRKKGSAGRIKPRSDKHARELELNRRAATKCRNRQKAFIEQLQTRCKREEEKMHIQSSLVSALHDEVMELRNEILRQSLCDCRFIAGTGMPMIS